MEPTQGQGGLGGTPESGAPGAGSGAGTIPNQGGGQQYGSGGGGAEAAPWESDERFRGKSAKDVWQSYTDLQKKIGGYGELEKRVGQWEAFGKAWEPHLKAVNYDPNRLAHALERAAGQAQRQGQPEQAQQLQAWADALTPQDQEQWLTSRMQQVEQRQQQQLQQVSSALVDYFNRFGDLALRAVEQKFSQLPEAVRPKLAINDLLQEAVNIATNRYDPLEWAMRIKTAEPAEEMEKRIRADERAKAEAELKNRQLTTFSGSGSGAPRTMRPRTAVPNGQGQGPVRQSEAEAIGSARERFVGKWNEIAPS